MLVYIKIKYAVNFVISVYKNITDTSVINIEYLYS